MVPGNGLMLIFFDKKKCVRINNSISEVLPVPIWSIPILGLLLFIIYINDLPSFLQEMLPFLFADDVKCMLAAKTTENFNITQVDLYLASNWSMIRNLSFN